MAENASHFPLSVHFICTSTCIWNTHLKYMLYLENLIKKVAYNLTYIRCLSPITAAILYGLWVTFLRQPVFVQPLS